MCGKYCHKEKEFGETESTQEYNAFRKENSLGKPRLWGEKGVIRRPGYDLKTTGDSRDSMKINQWKDSVGDKGKICRGNG